MNIVTLVSALRFGQAIGRNSAFKWAGYVGLVAGFAFHVAKANGYLDGVSEDEWFGLVSVAMDFLVATGTYAVVATNEKLGVLPKAKGDIADLSVGDNASGELRDEQLQTDASQPSKRSATEGQGFPTGHFWDR